MFCFRRADTREKEDVTIFTPLPSTIQTAVNRSSPDSLPESDSEEDEGAIPQDLGHLPLSGDLFLQVK